jgi:hypothetical protein
MQTDQTVKRGGRREGAGRPKGSGRYGEPTASVRVPLSLVAEVEKLISDKTHMKRVFMAMDNKQPWPFGRNAFSDIEKRR